MKEANKKKEEKIKELQDFISRFSANASKSKQATSRKKALEKIQLDDIKPSSRKYPYIDFRPNREIGNDVLQVEGLTKTVDGVKILDNLSFTLGREDKVAFVGSNEQAIHHAVQDSDRRRRAGFRLLQMGRNHHTGLTSRRTTPQNSTAT